MDGCISTPAGTLRVRVSDQGVRSVRFMDLPSRGSRTAPGGAHPFLQDALREIEMYFHGGLRRFTLTLDMHGTPFQRRVWTTVRRIPWGETRKYGDIARQIGSRGCRAVGGALRSNPLAILVPCHRVVSAAGVGGYSAGVERKVWLLRHEGWTPTREI